MFQFIQCWVITSCQNFGFHVNQYITRRGCDFMLKSSRFMSHFTLPLVLMAVSILAASLAGSKSLTGMTVGYLGSGSCRNRDRTGVLWLVGCMGLWKLWFKVCNSTYEVKHNQFKICNLTYSLTHVVYTHSCSFTYLV